jgi:SUKH superfamily protein
MHDLEALFEFAAPRDPPLTIEWDAARAALGVDLPDDYKALAEHYGSGTLAGLNIFIPGHPNRHADLLRQVEVKRDALRYLIERDIEQPYDPGTLLPWGSDDAGNTVWWRMEGDWPVVANEGRGEDWDRYDGAVAMVTGLLSGRLKSAFLTIEGVGFEPYPYAD